MAAIITLTFLVGAITGSIVAQISNFIHWKQAILNTFIAPFYTLLYYAITGMVVSYRLIKRIF